MAYSASCLSYKMGLFTGKEISLLFPFHLILHKEEMTSRWWHVSLLSLALHIKASGLVLKLYYEEEDEKEEKLFSHRPLMSDLAV